MSQDIEDQRKRKRAINFIVGIILAALHVALPTNFLRGNWRFEKFSHTALMEACVRAELIAACIALVVTIAALVIIKRFSALPSLLMVLVGNCLCPIVFLQIFQHLFYSVMDNKWVASSGISDPRIILFEVLKLVGVNLYGGLFVGLILSLVLTASFAKD